MPHFEVQDFTAGAGIAMTASHMGVLTASPPVWPLIQLLADAHGELPMRVALLVTLREGPGGVIALSDLWPSLSLSLSSKCINKSLKMFRSCDLCMEIIF